MRRTLTRLTVAGSAAALCAGLAVPAFAGTHPVGFPDGHKHSADALTADQLKAVVDASIARRLADLAEHAAKAAASTELTDAQKADAAARIQARVDALNALKASVDAETTVAGIKADLESFWLARLQSMVDTQVDKRVAQLTAALAKVAASTKLTDVQKSAVTARIQARIDALVALKAKVDAETTLAGARADLRAAHRLLGDPDRFGPDGRNGKGGKSADHGRKSGDPAKGVRDGRSGDRGRGMNEPGATVLGVTHGGYSTRAGHTGLNFPMGGGHGSSHGSGHGSSHGGHHR